MARVHHSRCPSCGAPLELERTRTCDFCHTVVSDPELKAGRGAPTFTLARRIALLVLLVLVALVIARVLHVPAELASVLSPPEQSTRYDASGTQASRRTNIPIQPGQSGLSPLPTPEEPATAEFSFHHELKTRIGSTWLFGMVKNTSSYPISAPQVVAVLHDAEGSELRTYRGYPDVSELEPGAGAPMMIVLDRPPEHARKSFEVSARRAHTVMPQAEGLQVIQGRSREGQGRYELEGRVANGGSTAAKLIKVIGVAYDQAGKVAGMASTYLTTTRLEPGESGRYFLPSVFVAAPAVRFEVYARGYASIEGRSGGVR